MTIISMLCPVCLGDMHERDHAFNCKPKEKFMTTSPTSSEETVRREPLVSELIDALDSACATQQEQHHARDALINFVRNSMAEISTQAHGAQIVREHFDSIVTERDRWSARAVAMAEERDAAAEERDKAQRERNERSAQLVEALRESDRLRQRVERLEQGLHDIDTAFDNTDYADKSSEDYFEAIREIGRLALSGEK